MLSNPHGNVSADYLLVKSGKVYYTEGKTSTGKNSLDHNFAKGSTQAERIMIDLTGTKDTNYIANELIRAFNSNEQLKEVKIFKRGREINISRQFLKNTSFKHNFKRIWEQKK